MDLQILGSNLWSGGKVHAFPCQGGLYFRTHNQLITLMPVCSRHRRYSAAGRQGMEYATFQDLAGDRVIVRSGAVPDIHSQQCQGRNGFDWMVYQPWLIFLFLVAV